MNAHQHPITELQAADDEELNPQWARIQPTEADLICEAVERWSFVIVLVMSAGMFWSCASRTWWCGLLAIGSLAFAGAVARNYRRGE